MKDVRAHGGVLDWMIFKVPSNANDPLILFYFSFGDALFVAQELISTGGTERVFGCVAQ